MRRSKFIPSFLLTFTLTGCLALASGAQSATRAKFEPAEGCYIGAFIENDDSLQGNIERFEGLTKKKHASYFTYVGYGRPFPMDWVIKVRERGAAPHIAFEPNNGLDEVVDDEYLRAWARDAARSQCPIFLRWASEMNGPWTAYGKDPAQYREKFRLVARVMKEEAPNVAMLWTPFAEPTRLIPPYYPGDDVVDWVGVNIYSVYVNNGDPLRQAHHKDPVDFLRYIYDNYAARKPIHVSEFAATIFCKGTSMETVDFAISKMTRFYTALREQFPRVKAVNWFSWDTINAGRAQNNYSVVADGRVLHRYRELINNEHFLSRVYFDPAEFAQRIPPGTTQGRNSVAMRPSRSVEEEVSEGSGAITMGITEPIVGGVKNGEVVRADLELTAQVPLTTQAAGIIWQIDGRAVALTNTIPYRVSIPRDRLTPGEHTTRILVLPKTRGTEDQFSDEVKFVVE